MPRHSYGSGPGSRPSMSHLSAEQKEIIRRNRYGAGGKRRTMRSKTSKNQKRRTRKNRRHTRKH